MTTMPQLVVVVAAVQRFSALAFVYVNLDGAIVLPPGTLTLTFCYLESVAGLSGTDTALLSALGPTGLGSYLLLTLLWSLLACAK